MQAEKPVRELQPRAASIASFSWPGKKRQSFLLRMRCRQRIRIGSREARRAVPDALPFLVAASSVTLLVVDSRSHQPLSEGDFLAAEIGLLL
jgi:hypothetical protein